MKLRLRALWRFDWSPAREFSRLARETFRGWRQDDALTLGAALSYYTTFSLAPLLIVVIAIAGVVFGREAVQGRLVAEIQGLVGRDGAFAVQTMIANASRQESGAFAAAAAVVLTLFGASGVFAQLQSSLNRIWNVPPKQTGSIKALIRARAVSFGMVLGIGFLLVVSLVLSAALTALDEVVLRAMPAVQAVLQLLNLAVSFAVITVLFAMIYRVLPDLRLEWRDVWIGAAVTAFLFTIGKFAIGLYIGETGVTSVFGAAGSLVVLLLWVYYSSQILFLGAEFTQVYARRHGSQAAAAPPPVSAYR